MSRKFLTVSALFLLFTASVFAQNAAVTVNVDAAANRKPISPLIYGVAFASSAELSDLNAPLNRSGGNAETRYNWQLNASNRGADWYFESLPESSAVAGEHGDTFISTSKSGGAQPMLTIPMIGWAPKLGTNRGRLSSFSIAKYGAQQGADWQWYPDAGNGVHTDGSRITNNDPNDANYVVDSLFQKAWVQHIVSQWGTAANGGLRYYMLDNESSIWQETHRDVHPVGATMDEIRDKMIDYGGKIKDVDPSAIVTGPEEWGWSGYFYSGYDQQYGAAHGWTFYPDRNNHGGADYLPWLLSQMKSNETSTGRRLLDIFTVHYYPQGGEFSNDTSSSMQLRRNRSTRSLWDPNYIDETWISDTVRLVPRLHEWVNAYYPGTKIGVTEYNWGAEGHINGATAQADILGIFGREGLDVATRWTTPDASTPTYKAIKIYRNYDGGKSTFGDTSVAASVPNPDNLSAFAAVRSSDGALTVMVISKVLSGTTPVTLSLANFTGGTAQVWRLTSSNAIQRLADVSVSSNTLSTEVPAQSVSLYVISKSGTTPSGPTAAVSGGATICSGGSATIQAALTGTAPWSLVWSDGYAQSASVSPATRTVSPSVTTSYTITALSDVNGPGSSTGSATITVQSAPAITKQPASSTIKRKGSATLSVSASGASLSYQWYQGLSGNTSVPVGSNSATFKTPRLSSTTSYWVRVRNNCGNADSVTATVTVR